MAEYQKFIFGENYSTEPANIKKIQDNKLVEAKQMLANDIEQAKQHAFEQGFQEGQKMALEKLKTEMDTHITTLIDSITKINEYKPQLHDIYEEQSTACVRHLVKNLFYNANEIIPEKILDQAINNALSNLPMVSKILIKVPANCKAYLRDTQIEAKVQERGINDFAFIEDNSLQKGECRIEWDQSGVLASKVESFEKINFALNSFLSESDIELSENTVSTGEQNIDKTGNLNEEIPLESNINEPNEDQPVAN